LQLIPANPCILSLITNLPDQFHDIKNSAFAVSGNPDIWEANGWKAFLKFLVNTHELPERQ
jgi:hypothetical protein